MLFLRTRHDRGRRGGQRPRMSSPRRQRSRPPPKTTRRSPTRHHNSFLSRVSPVKKVYRDPDGKGFAGTHSINCSGAAGSQV